jgi:hypothetical protein
VKSSAVTVAAPLIGRSARFWGCVVAKLYTLTIRNRAAAAVFAIAILGLGAVFLTVGLALLAGLAVVGGVLGAGYAVVRRLRGDRLSQVQSMGGAFNGLDPALEVRPAGPPQIAAVKDHTD